MDFIDHGQAADQEKSWNSDLEGYPKSGRRRCFTHLFCTAGSSTSALYASELPYLGSALLALIEEPENRARLACKGRTVARRFTSERMTLSYENAFDEGLTAILGARG